MPHRVPGKPGVARALAASATILALSTNVEAASLRAEYRLTLAGIQIGTADLSGELDDDRYALSLSGQLTGIAGALSGSSRGAATARGSVAGARLVSAGFSASGGSASGERTLQIGMSSGNVTDVRITPPFEERPDRVPLRDVDKRAVVDPLSALVGVQAGAKPLDPANCARTLPVFEGTQRFDVVLSYAETRTVQLGGYGGDVVVCNARYVPVAGHRPARPAVKFMAENREISVWLAPVGGGTRFLAPLRISVMTMLGASVVEATSWRVTPAAGR